MANHDIFADEEQALAPSPVSVRAVAGEQRRDAMEADLEWKAYTIVSWRLHTIDHLKQIKKAIAART